ncbi:MAG: ABC transporter permease, partial [Actinomycetota bacterium]|nr:ABC transporter permease [Actinomycetota bacterium]
ARRSLRRGRVGTALAGFQLSRRPGAVRLFALLTTAVAVIGYAASAVDVAARGRAAESVIGTGATRVVEVGPTGRQNLLRAVRAVDPSGSFAMAAMRLPKDPAAPTVVAVDASRLAAVAAWPSGAPSAASVAAALRGSGGNPPVDVDGAKVTLDLTAAGFRPGKAVALSLVLSPRSGGNDETVALGVLRNGRNTYGQTVPACANGCTLNSLRIAGGEGTLDVAGNIVVHRLGGGAPGDGVPSEVLTDAARWRGTEGGRVSAAPDGLHIEVTSLNGLPSGMFVLPATAPYPLPVATAGIAALPSIRGLDARPVQVAAGPSLPAVPGAGAPAVLTDLDHADHVATDGGASSNGMVWLNERAPPGIVDRLAAQGLTITADVRAADVRARLDTQGPAIALWFYVIVAVLATALATGALTLAASVDRNRRVEDLSALRSQGLTRSALRQATLWTYPVLMVVAVLAGSGVAMLGWWLTGWALPLAGLTPTAIPLPAWPRGLTIALT